MTSIKTLVGAINNEGIKLFAKANTLRIKKSKGDVNYLIIIAAVAVVFIIVGWPILKTIVGTIFDTISNWFTSNLNKVFS